MCRRNVGSMWIHQIQKISVIVLYIAGICAFFVFNQYGIRHEIKDEIRDRLIICLFSKIRR